MDLSIIIVSFNTKKLTVDCIKSVVKYIKGIDYEIIVVDNGSKDKSITGIKSIKGTTGIKTIENKSNLGFAAANNQGLKIAKGRYFLLLNSDTIVGKNILGEMVSWMDKHPKVGIASCALLNEDGSIQGSGGFEPTLFKVFLWMSFIEDLPSVNGILKPYHPISRESFFGKVSEIYKRAHRQDWVTGAFVLGRRELINDVGLFDEKYFMYVEEVDFAKRVKDAGWEIWYLPEFRITHLGGASGGSEYGIKMEFGGLRRFYRKFYPSWQYPILLTLLFMGSLARIVLFTILGRPRLARIYASILGQSL